MCENILECRITAQSGIQQLTEENLPVDIMDSSLAILLKKSQLYLKFNLFRKSLENSDYLLSTLKKQTESESKADTLFHLNHKLRFKGIELKAKALFGLGRFNEGLHILKEEIKYLTTLLEGIRADAEEVSNVYKRRQEIKHLLHLLGKGKELENQSKTGDIIDMGNFLPNRKIRLEVEALAEYKGTNIDIGANIPSKGRGVVALQDIPKGSLILASRAFEIVFDTDDDDDDLEQAIAQKLRLDPELIPDVYQLHAGKEMGSIKDATSQNIIDLKRIAGICTMNSFGNSRNSSGYGHNSRGLWILPSFFNHDCIDFNCMWKVLGDFLFIRVSQDVKEGDELLITYTDSSEIYEERETFFSAHDFICGCRLCTFQINEDSNVRKRRLEILEKLNKIDDNINKSTDIPSDISFAEKCLKELEEMGTKRQSWNFARHVALDLLCKLYLKTENLNYKEMAEEYYVVINGSQEEKEEGRVCLEVGAAAQVASVQMKAKDFPRAQKWIRVLHQDLSLVYGNAQNLLKKLYPQLYSLAVQNDVL